jgi:serine/threonine-protein kinase
MALNPPGVKLRYEVREPISRTGMSVVYKAYDKVLKRPVALKTILDLTDSRAIKLFQKECEDLASLIHPNIVEILDVGQMEDEGGVKPYLVMPLLPGVTLDSLIRGSSSRLTVERCVDIFCQTCRGLYAVHERGLIHRDLKPSNIFVMEDDSVKIIDFGIAHRLDNSQTVGQKGTLLYMSPEQIVVKPLTPASDIFSLGVVCYESLTLRRPFELATENEVAEAILRHIPAPVHELNPSIPLAVSQAVHKAMAKEPLHRYRSAREFAETLQKALHNEPIEIFNPSRLQPRMKRAREAFTKGDYDYAREILGEIESEGHLDKQIGELREAVERARLERRISQLIQTAQARMDEQEYQLALQKVEEALQIDSKNTDALALKSRIEARRTDRDIEGWFDLARTHLENRAFGPAREALRRILELRPRETKAAQLLSEVERLELQHQRIKGEKENLYRAAVEAERAGDLSSALSKLDRVLELDKQAPEPTRTGTYQREYEKVHSEYEELKAARTEAKRLLDDQKFSQARAICEQYLTKYPADTLLQALKWDIQEKQRQAMSARIAETDRRIEAEPDLDRQVSILEQAVSEYPGEVYFERALHNARERRDGVNAIVARARGLEEKGQFPEALGQWEMLQAIYARYPGLRFEIDRLTKRRDQGRRQEAIARWIEQIDQQLDSGDFARALELVEKATGEFPDDGELAELGRLARQGAERRAEAQRLLALATDACAGGLFNEGVELLRQAHDLDGNDNRIRNLLVENRVEQGRRLMDADPRAAEALLNQALELEPNHTLAKGLLRMLADQRKMETIDRTLAQARRFQAGGDLQQALQVVNQALVSYPNEQRLLQSQASLQKALDDLQRKEFEQVRRIQRELDAINDVSEEQQGQYSGRLNGYMTKYPHDREFTEEVRAAKRRLETIVEGRRLDPMVAPNPAGAAPARAPESGGTDRDQTLPESVPGGLSGSRQVSGGLGAMARRTWSRVAALKHPLTSKEIWVGTAAAAAVLLTIALAKTYIKPSKPVAAPAPEGSIAITTRPPGAAVSVAGAKVEGANGSYTVRGAPTTYDLVATLHGYQQYSEKLTIQAGYVPSKVITLVPELPVLRILGSGMAYLDGDEPVEIANGQIERQLSPADHSVRVAMNRTSELSFKVHVEADGLPVISDISTREVAPLIVNDFGSSAKIYGWSNTPTPVQMNGQKLGDLKSDGLDLPPLQPANYELQVGDGKDAKTRTIEISPGRTITVLLEADPSVGRLLVRTTEDGATVVLLAGGREVARKTTVKGQASFTNVRTGPHSVQVMKDGYDTDREKAVDIVKGVEANLSFELHRRTVPGTLQVKTTPGAEVIVDGDRKGLAGAEPVAVRADDAVTAEYRLPPVGTKIEKPVDPMEKYWAKGVWSPPDPNRWYVHRGEAFLGAAHMGPAIIEFAAILSESGVFKGHKLIWAANYTDNRNYVKFELTEKDLTFTSIKDKDKRGTIKKPVKAVEAGAPYSIRLDWRANSITVSINGNIILEKAGDFQGGQFGFLGNKEVTMANFMLEGN